MEKVYLHNSDSIVIFTKLCKQFGTKTFRSTIHVLIIIVNNIIVQLQKKFGNLNALVHICLHM